MNMGVKGPLGVYGYLHAMVRGILYFRVLCMGNGLFMLLNHGVLLLIFVER